MALICQNCGSNDVVSIQGQEFCINCGSIVIVPKVEPTAPIPQPAAPVLVAKPVAVKHVTLQQLNKANPTPVDELKRLKPKDQPPEPKPPAVARPDLREGHHAPITHDAKAHPVSYSFKIASSLAAVVALAISGGLWFGFDADIMLYLSLSSALVVVVLLMLSQSALLYGLSRAQDGRPAERKKWWSVARGGYIEVLNADLATLIIQFIGIAAGFSLWQAYIRVHGSSNNLDVAMLVLGNILIAWLLIGSLAARRIAVPAVIIGNLSGTKAVKLGWKCYLRAGGHLIIALIETWVARLALVLALITAAVAANHYLGNISNQTVIISVGVGLFVAILAIFMLILQIETRVWLRQYRQWVNTFLASQRLKLLSGRHHKPH